MGPYVYMLWSRAFEFSWAIARDNMRTLCKFSVLHSLRWHCGKLTPLESQPQMIQRFMLLLFKSCFE